MNSHPAKSDSAPSVRLLAAGAHRTLSGWLEEDVRRGAERAQWLEENHEALSLAAIAEETDALQRRYDVLREAVMRLRPALRNGNILETIKAIEEVARG